MYEYYLSKHMPPPPECREVMEEAESSAPAYGACEVHGAEDEVEDGGVALGEVDTAATCVAATNTSWSIHHRHQSARRLRRRPRAAHQPVKEVEDRGMALGEVEVAAARVAGEARDGEDGAAVLREVEATVARVVAEAMAEMLKFAL
ncbi:hypothetical protein E2562_021768 [Oryza meyeriana var. granulata]|uniref:Uncharacterized protein n=1 Tax=Oryza meyeriana var. granulata TaxID=110450 RepID=A0A6G1EY62_9ORYZ|nr:hypothetical protein E2562_021768 [Oryza meyeriana var. granulata]